TCSCAVIPLKSYVCSFSSTNAACNQNNQECQQPLDTCMTIVDALGPVTAIVKQHASSTACNGTASTAFVDANGNSVSCCGGYDYCHYSGAGSVHTHTPPCCSPRVFHCCWRSEVLLYRVYKASCKYSDSVRLL
uniref:Uncharacterized protein n=1 Tax=Nothobranchius furzeri TaxID=105023 RepID=A0A8C6PL13_NOTFU